MSDPFARMHSRLAARLGASSTINGEVTAAPVVIEKGVAVSGEYGEVVGYRDVAVISVADSPKGGDALVVDGASHTIDSIMENNGYVVRCVLR